MSGRPIAVVAALREELRPLLRRLQGARLERRQRVVVMRGQLSGRQVVLAVTGDGAAAAGRGVAAVLDGYRPAFLLGLGVAGGLSPDLPMGSLVAARAVLDQGGSPRAADPDLLRRVLATGRVVEGLLATGKKILDSGEQKRDLWRRLGEPARAAVDLESAAWSGAAADRRVPWLVVRAISDSADEELPLPFARLASRGGRVGRSRVLAHLAIRPWRVPATLALGRRVRSLAERLAELAEELLS